MSGPDRAVSLRLITDDNRAAVEALAVTPAQSHYVASKTYSLREAAETPDALPWYRAIHADDEPVGFLMINDGIPAGHPLYLGPYFLWRLMIDARHQGRGYGSAALDLLRAELRTRPDARVLLSSVVPGNLESPRGFYLRYGFRFTGAWHDDEEVIELPL